jgi:effector-binding domain-containing protein
MLGFKKEVMELKGQMLGIGEFSRMSMLTVKALRHYDEQGVLKPYVDPESGYRYYSLAQLRDAGLIALLRSLEVPLPEVHILVNLRDQDQLRQALREHRACIEEKTARYGSILSQLDRLIDGEEGIMQNQVEIKEVPAQFVVSIREHTPVSGMPELFQGAFGELFPYVFQMGARPAGPPLTIYHDQEFKEEDVDVEICVPVERLLEPSGRVTSRELPAGKVLSIMHAGPYDGVGEVYQALGAYQMEHGLEMAGPPREVYLVGPGQVEDPAEYRTEILWPIA